MARLFAEAVADAKDSADETGLRGDGLDLAAQGANVHIERAGIVKEIGPPHLFHQEGAGEGLAGVGHEGGQEPALHRSQVPGRAVDDDLLGGDIKGEATGG